MNSIRRVRVGIDVGGTFTHAVAVSPEGTLVCKVKVPTTHASAEGVAEGVYASLQKLLEDAGLSPDAVDIVCHSTTQATNALLEGDVAKVGIVCVGSGMAGARAKTESLFDEIPLGGDKKLLPLHAYMEEKNGEINIPEAQKIYERFKKDSVHSIVAVEAFSVDHPEKESQLVEEGKKFSFLGTATHQMTKLYGLRKRTRTACINASILPKMMDAAEKTGAGLKKIHVDAPLMVLRSDGGMMPVEEVKSRPLLTLLSGPAAGVASALSFARVWDGVFIEVGGTSTDISLIAEGKPFYSMAYVGEHALHLNTLDVHTLGVAGGSLLRVKNGKIVDVGPRSAHIAGFSYACFSNAETIKNAELVFVSPKHGDAADHVALKAKEGKLIAITPSCAANVLGLAREGDAARGNKDASQEAFIHLSRILNTTPENAAEQLLECAAQKIQRVVSSLLQNAKNKNDIMLVGGGGGAAALVPYTAKKMNLPHKIAEHHDVISAIGAANAMLHESFEKHVPTPSEDIFIQLKNEAREKLLSRGANPETLTIEVTYDAQKSIAKISATAAYDFEMLTKEELSNDALFELAAECLGADVRDVKKTSELSGLVVFEYAKSVKKLFKTQEEKKHCVFDRLGVLKLKLQGALLFEEHSEKMPGKLKELIDAYAVYSDGGKVFPAFHLVCGAKVVKLSQLPDEEKILLFAKEALSGIPPTDKALVFVSR